MLFLSLGLAVVLSTLVAAAPNASPAAAPGPAALAERATSDTCTSDCSRDCMTNIVRQVLDSMVAHDPTKLPLALTYKATENSHPTALSMMTSWRTITKAGPPTLLAIDTTNSSAFFELDISEGNDATQNVLRGRIQVVNRTISELELFINRYRGDHGFSFNATELPINYAPLMSLPANRTKPSREDLVTLSEALFASSGNYTPAIDDNCQFSEIGWRVVDPGTYGNGSTEMLGCSWPAAHPTDDNARTSLVVDEELGFVITSGIVPGTVFPYGPQGYVSAFIPNTLSAPQLAQVQYAEYMKSQGVSLLAPTNATGDTLEVLQFYNGKLQAMMINVYLSGPGMTSPWL